MAANLNCCATDLLVLGSTTWSSQQSIQPRDEPKLFQRSSVRLHRSKNPLRRQLWHASQWKIRAQALERDRCFGRMSGARVQSGLDHFRVLSRKRVRVPFDPLLNGCTVSVRITFIQAKEGLFDAAGEIGPDSRKFLQGWMDKYVEWIKKHAG